jgi:hypothetical protein
MKILDVRFLPSPPDELRLGSRFDGLKGFKIIVLFHDDPEWCLSWCWEHDGVYTSDIAPMHSLKTHRITWGNW